MDDAPNRTPAAQDPSAQDPPGEEHPAGPARPPHTRRGAFRLGALAGLTFAAMVALDREGGGVTPCQITCHCSSALECPCPCHGDGGRLPPG
ncbi:MAG TPA: hypothetical protein VGD67_03715 [Pseudonocardiaceae bacterium]